MNVDPGSDFFTTAPTGPDDIVTTGSDELYLSNMSTPPARLTGFSKLTPSYSSLPASFITPTALSERGWSATRVGWLSSVPDFISDAQIADARQRPQTPVFWSRSAANG